jgi:hypothetical protein
MQLYINDGELCQIAQFINTMSNPKATRAFNSMITNRGTNHVKMQHSQNNTAISIDNETSSQILNLLIKNGYTIGQLSNSSGISLIGKIKQLWDSVQNDIRIIINK